MTLFVTDRRPLPAVDCVANEADRHGAGHSVAGADDRQIDLFAPRAVLVRELEVALVQGRFAEAERVRLTLEHTFGPSLETRDLRYLDRLGALAWKGPPGEALALWTEIDAHLAERPHLRARVRDGVFARLLESHTPATLVDAQPECLPALAVVLESGQGTSPDDGRRRARALVRDALVSGRGLESLDFSHDPAIADLLAEDFSPRWLACLGVIRRLWAAPPLEEADLAAFGRAGAREPSDDEAAEEFWRCLRVAEDPGGADERVHEARRRMKRLQPDLHGQYMRRAAVRLRG